MTLYLLDVNVLIALIDPANIKHDMAHQWFTALGEAHWATCPFTENAVLRIVGKRAYSNSPGPPSAVAEFLAPPGTQLGHVSWPNSFSLLNSPIVNPTRLLTPDQITDTYLLALARSHAGSLATFDRRLIPDAVQDGARTIHLIG